MTAPNSDQFYSASELLPTEKLPYEIWMKIISYLNYSDLKQLHMTDNFFNSVVRIPMIKKSKLLITPETYEGLKRSVLCSDEILSFYMIEVNGVPLDDDLRQILIKCATPRLERLIVSNVDVEGFTWTFIKPFPDFEAALLRLEHLSREKNSLPKLAYEEL